ncbi:MAG: DHH family phosphoesterase [Halobacteriota archaeon]
MGKEGKGSGTEHSSKEKAIQVILGCGSIGTAVAKELVGQGKEDVVIVDINEKKVELLKEEDFIAFAGDISEPGVVDNLRTEGEPEVFFILSSDGEVNKKAAMRAKERFPEAQLVVRAISPGDKDAMKELDVDVILATPDITARAAMEFLERMKFRKRAKELIATIEAIKEVRGGKLGIVIHDSPDTDAIASALALKYIARHVGVSADILYRGEIGHHENRAFLNILGIEMRRIEEEDAFNDYEKLALVDVAVPGANNPLPPGSKVDIIIDHHGANNHGKAVDADFIDIQPDIGATSTIMMRYLQELDLPADKVLATALLHGIRTDTDGFRRETHTSDFSAAAFLYVTADKDLLEQIETPPMSTEMLNVIGSAIQNKKIKGSYLITNVGAVTNRDAIPEAADYLLNLEGITTVMVIGLCEDRICISGRSKDIRVNIGDAFVHAFHEIGSAGGHATMAAAQLPLGVFSVVKDKEVIMQLAEDAVSRRFLAVLKEKQSE